MSKVGQGGLRIPPEPGLSQVLAELRAETEGCPYVVDGDVGDALCPIPLGALPMEGFAFSSLLL
ncbi:MAG: hypothetical protein U9R11_05095 [Chloroflexota bacterium]|nr:hypothetical protein [Chloroflexota bacterium]